MIVSVVLLSVAFQEKAAAQRIELEGPHGGRIILDFGQNGQGAPPIPQYPSGPQQNQPDITKMVQPGLWGTWQQPVMIPQRHRIVGFRIRFEPDRRGGDDTALNGIEILYRDKSLRGPVQRLMVHPGLWGDWKNDVIAPEGYEVVALKTRFENSVGRGDDTALNGIQMLTLNRRTGQHFEMMVENGLWGLWQDAFKGLGDRNYYLAGMAVRFEPNQGRGDDTAMNGIVLIYRAVD